MIQLKPQLKTSDFSNSTFYGNFPSWIDIMRVRLEPSRYAKKCFSLLLLTIRKLIFTRTHVPKCIALSIRNLFLGT